MVSVEFKKLKEDAKVPFKENESDTGFDIYAMEDVYLKPGETTVIPTGIAMNIEEGYDSMVRPRSGVTSKSKLRVQIGTIDNEYNQEVGIIIDNISQERRKELEGVNYLDIKDHPISSKEGLTQHAGTYKISKGSKIAQLTFHKLEEVSSTIVKEFSKESTRGGFGSSGY